MCVALRVRALACMHDSRTVRDTGDPSRSHVVDLLYPFFAPAVFALSGLVGARKESKRVGDVV